ncbi:MAG: phage tail tube protein [Ruminococcus sp.]
MKTGVFPCYENQFQIGEAGVGTPSTQIANCEEFSVSFDNGVEEWNSFESKGWKDRLMTAKSIIISVKGKRTVGDEGNDLVAGLAFKNGRDVEKDFQWTFPDGSTTLFPNSVISVTNVGSGASTNPAPLEFEVMSNGKPVYTPAA